MQAVLLFKTPQPGRPSETDPYHRLLTASGLAPVFVPVLEETFQTGELESVLASRDERERYDAVIVTSRRGAEGWIRAASAVQRSHHGMSPLKGGPGLGSRYGEVDTGSDL